MTTPRTRSRAEGFALPAAVWLSLFLFALLAGVLALSGGQRERTGATLMRERLRLAAEAATATEVKRLLDAKGDGSEVLAVYPLTHVFDGIATEVYVTNEAGRINVNTAEADLLNAYFGLIDDGSGDGARLAKNLLAYRKDHLLQNVDELVRVEGFTPRLLAIAAEDLTVYSDSPTVVPRFAPPRVRDTLESLGRMETEGKSLLRPEEFLSAPIWRIAAHAKSGEGYTLRTETVIRLAPASNRPYQVFVTTERF